MYRKGGQRLTSVAVSHTSIVVEDTCWHSHALLMLLIIAVLLQASCRFRIRIGSESGSSAANVVTGLGSAVVSRFTRSSLK